MASATTLARPSPDDARQRQLTVSKRRATALLAAVAIVFVAVTLTRSPATWAGYVEAAEAYFRSRVERQSLESLAAKYRALDALAVLLAWDAETATGRPRVPNATVAAAVSEHPDAFTGIGSVDPHKASAVDEVAEIAALGLRGVKFHPSLQAFAPDDERFWPVFAVGAAASLLIELVQGLLGNGTCHSDDLVRNTAGAAIGAGIGIVAAQVYGREPPPPVTDR